MAIDVDTTDLSPAETRARLFAGLDSLGSAGQLTITTEDSLGPLLALYQLQRGRALEWDIEDSTTRVEFAGEPNSPIEFDVRSIPPQRRHDLLTDAFDALDPTDEFVLINDHDPKPLYYEFQSTRGDVVSWEYESERDGEWRVVVGKTAPATSEREDVFTAFDVRKIPKQERHPAIHHRYSMIPEGATMEIVAPHEPRPLHREFRERYGDAFEWEVVESELGRCRVTVTKTETTARGEQTEGHASCGHAESGHSHDHHESADTTTAELTLTEELDVRDLPPAQRHEKIFSTYADLAAGEGFVLVNDHDPKPLYHQFEAETGEGFRWEYQQRDSGEFRVLIGKTADSATTGEQPEAPF